MAVNKVIYDGETLLDLTNDSVTEDTLLSGVTAHNAAGEAIVGTVTVPTKVSQLENDSGLATEIYVNNKVAGIVDSAPATLDTLNELAAALGDDPNFATTIANQIGTKVDKVNGKGLSTNDYTTTEKTKLSSIAEGAEVNQNAFSNVIVGSVTVAADNKTDTLTLVAGDNVTLTPDATNDKITIASKDTVYTHPSYTSKSSGLYKITVDGTGHISGTTMVTKSDITALGIPGELTPISIDLSTDAADNTKVAGAKAVVDYVNSHLTSVYKPQGSVDSLPTPAAGLEGNVYNMSAEFTTTDVFVEGAGKKYPAGTNIVVVKVGNAYKLDVLAGFIDLTPYAKSADVEKTYVKKTDITDFLTKTGDASSVTLIGVTDQVGAVNIVTIINDIISKYTALAERVANIEADYMKSTDFSAMTTQEVQTAWNVVFGT